MGVQNEKKRKDVGAKNGPDSTTTGPDSTVEKSIPSKEKDNENDNPRLK